MNKRQAKKLARNHWKRFFAKELTRLFLPTKKIKPSQVIVKEEHIEDEDMIKITGEAAGREICIKLYKAYT